MMDIPYEIVIFDFCNSIMNLLKGELPNYGDLMFGTALAFIIRKLIYVLFL
jgi:hypothetical protein